MSHHADSVTGHAASETENDLAIAKRRKQTSARSAVISDHARADQFTNPRRLNGVAKTIKRFGFLAVSRWLAFNNQQRARASRRRRDGRGIRRLECRPANDSRASCNAHGSDCDSISFGMKPRWRHRGCCTNNETSAWRPPTWRPLSFG